MLDRAREKLEREGIVVGGDDAESGDALTTATPLSGATVTTQRPPRLR